MDKNSGSKNFLYLQLARMGHCSCSEDGILQLSPLCDANREDWRSTKHRNGKGRRTQSVEIAKRGKRRETEEVGQLARI
jgi:hypothetical protein